MGAHPGFDRTFLVWKQKVYMYPYLQYMGKNTNTMTNILLEFLISTLSVAHLPEAWYLLPLNK